MILDTGILTVFRREDIAAPGGKPVWHYEYIARGWYGVLAFETSPVWETEARQSRRADARVRILQRRDILQYDVVVLRDVESFAEVQQGEPVYRITRAYHGPDETGATLITDLTLEVVTP